MDDVTHGRNYKAAVAKRVRNLREARDWSQLDVARKLGYQTKTQVNKIEKADAPITLELVDRLARVFELPGGAVEFLAISPPIWPELGDETKLEQIINAKLAEAAQEALEREELGLDSNFLESLVLRVDTHIWRLDEFAKDMRRIQARLRVWIDQSRKEKRP